MLQKSINFIYNGKTSYATVPPKKTIKIKLPFLSTRTYIAKRKLSALITKFYLHDSIRFIITPSLTLRFTASSRKDIKFCPKF